MNELTIPLTRAEKLILERIDSLQQDIAELKKNNSLDEFKTVSANTACRMLNIGHETLVKHINEGKIPAKTSKVNGTTRYRIKLSAIRAFQTSNSKMEDTPQNKYITGKEIWKKIQMEKDHGNN